MTDQIAADALHLDALLAAVTQTALTHLSTLDEQIVVPPPTTVAHPPVTLPADSRGAVAALHAFATRHAAALTASVGPRYWGFVTGGSTPAALAGDWLTAAYDQNAADNTGAAAQIEREAITMLQTLLGLPTALDGMFVTGATMANVVGLATAREWVAQQHGHSIAADGLAGLPPIPVLSGAPHSCIAKALAMLGLGRNALRPVPLQPGRESVDTEQLDIALTALNGVPAIVVGNAGTVNTGDFDDLRALRALCDRHRAWLHVDAAFGAFAACAPATAALVAGMDTADSLAVDLHKWLNVPYDSAVALTRRRDLQYAVFNNASATYLVNNPDTPGYVHLGPENSRRLRALPAWLTLQAYGTAGYGALVERCCALAATLGAQISAEPALRLLAPVRLNIACFTLANAPTAERIRAWHAAISASGELFVSVTQHNGIPALRAALNNWRTQDADLARGWEVICRTARELDTV